MKIKRLSDNVINLIAAGEVVERPSSVIKELVENSIDAGADKIQVWLEEAGKNLIIISDNGSGMGIEDLTLAVDRHATSKLDEADITNISSFGFRGEALASISSISRLTIDTCDNENNKGLRLSINNSSKNIHEVYAQKGTKITIRDLFYATPARLKFLKSDKVELALCLEVLRKLAIAYPLISFECHHNNKLMFSMNLQTDLTQIDPFQARISCALGEEFIASSIAVNEKIGDITITGYVGLPTYHKSTNIDQYFFCNKRPIKDKILFTALKIAYQDFLMSGRHPCVVLLLDLDPYLIDVNVHPCKTEIRFRDEATVRSAIITVLKTAIYNSAHKAADMSLAVQNLAKPLYTQPAVNSYNNYANNERNSGYSYPKANYYQNTSSNFADKNDYTYKKQQYLSNDNQYFNSPPQTHNKEIIQDLDAVNYPLGASCGQLHNTYIVSQTKDGIVIIDQHAAHERILYEELKKQMLAQDIIKQQLLVPIVIKIVDNLRKVNLEQNIHVLKDSGFKIEIINDNQAVLYEIPKLLSDCNLEELFRDIIDELTSNGITLKGDKLIEKITETYACHHSIRAGKKLSISEMNALLRKMENTPHSGQCNHGRPTYIQLKLEDIEKLFSR